uniref:Uncharacterized protein n=1 Tax=Oryza glumipatula TaxID=40148 RepID=A0A0E0A7Y3_9ORYZ
MASWRRRALAPRVLLGAARRGRLRRAVPAPRMAPRGRRWDAGCAHVDAEHPSFVLRLRNTMLSTLVRYGVSIDASRSDYSGGQKPEAGARGDERKKEQMKNIMRRLKGIILAAARWTRPPSSTRPLGTSSCSRWRSRSSVCVAQATKCATGRPDVDNDLAQRLTGTRMEVSAVLACWEDLGSDSGEGIGGMQRWGHVRRSEEARRRSLRAGENRAWWAGPVGRLRAGLVLPYSGPLIQPTYEKLEME